MANLPKPQLSQLWYYSGLGRDGEEYWIGLRVRFPSGAATIQMCWSPLTINYTIPWPLATINHMTTAARLNL